jgi:hypothetical protein
MVIKILKLNLNNKTTNKWIGTRRRNGSRVRGQYEGRKLGSRRESPSSFYPCHRRAKGIAKTNPR